MDSPEKNISITRDSPTKKEYKLNESKFAQMQLFFHLKIFQITQKIGRKKTCLFFVILGCLLQAGSSLFLKLTIYDYPKIRLSQSIFYRCFFILIINSSVIELKQAKFRNRDFKQMVQKDQLKYISLNVYPRQFWVQNINIIRTVFSVISQFFIFYALEFIEIGEVMVIYMTFPVWNVLGGKIFNGEQIQCKKYFYGLISLLGFLIMLEPDYIFSKFHYFDELNESIHETIQQDGENMDLITYKPQRFRGQMYSLIGAIGAGFSFNIQKLIQKSSQPDIMLQYFYFGCLIVSSIMVIQQQQLYYSPKQPDSEQPQFTIEYFSNIVIQALLSYFGMILYNIGGSLDQNKTFIISSYSLIIFSYALEYLFFQFYLDGINIIGMIIILTCNFCMRL